MHDPPVVNKRKLKPEQGRNPGSWTSFRIYVGFYIHPFHEDLLAKKLDN